MEKIICPLCGDEVVLVRDTDLFGIMGRVIGPHRPSPAAVLNGTAVARYGPWKACLAVGMEAGFAREVAADRKAGLHLLPHP